MSSGGGSGVNISMPTYEGSLEQALRSQVNLLQGSGQFEDIGSLQNLVEQYERPLRMSQAQIGTDVLRQTLLGDEFPVTGFKSVKPEETVPVKSTTGTGNLIDYTRGQYPNSTIEKETGKIIIGDGEIGEMQGKVNAYLELFKIDGPRVGKAMNLSRTQSGYNRQNGSNNIKVLVDGEYQEFPINLNEMNEIFQAFAAVGGKDPNGFKKKYGIDKLDDAPNGKQIGGRIAAHAILYKQLPGDIASSAQSQIIIPEKKYFKNEDGTDFVVPKDDDGNFIYYADNEEEATEAGGDLYNLQEIQTTRGGTGLVDLLGDTRDLTEYKTRSATQEDVDAGRADEVGDSITEAVETNRQAGFDAQGQFKGLSVLAEDIQRGNLSRQREADLADVERLAGRYSTLMEDFKPASSSGLQGARDLLEEQRENLTGLRKATQADVDAGLASEVGETFQTGTGSGGPITIPTGDTFGGEVTAATMESAEVADPLQLKANTQFQGELATGEGNQDTLRSSLLGDARTALGQGLTEREQAQVANAARARQTLMGRTFDQSGAIAEAEARVAEDNARRMQNRAFAQSVLGQEAGLQQGDITRGMAQESEQAGLQQQVNLTQAQMDQQANAFGADAAQRTAMANQAQRQQANQFGVGARLDAEKANEQLRQQGLANYVQAVGNLSQIERESGLDPFQALLGRGGGTALQQGQSVFGQANYGLQSEPQYLNPEAGLGYISNMAANQANMYAANVAADASRSAGLMGGLGSLGGGLAQGIGAAGSVAGFFCWVAREVYGPTNPAWLQFRDWMLNESPQWFFDLYAKYGERFASWISNKPRLKGIIRKWMDSKIGDK